MHKSTIDIKIKRLKSLSFIQKKVCRLHSFYCYVSLCMCIVCVNCCKMSLGSFIFGLGRSYTLHNPQSHYDVSFIIFKNLQV
jgi:hypothetical protein